MGSSYDQLACDAPAGESTVLPQSYLVDPYRACFRSTFSAGGCFVRVGFLAIVANRPSYRLVRAYQFLSLLKTHGSCTYSLTLTMARGANTSPDRETVRKEIASRFSPRKTTTSVLCPGSFTPTVTGLRHACSRELAVTEHRIV